MDESLSNVIPVEAVQERDTDLLVLEELKSNSNFRDWFLSKTIGSIPDYEFEGAWHSLTQVGLGESDLAFIVISENIKTLFLLENKIDADFQPDQAERYRKRGENRIKDGQCDKYYTVLLAPKKYIVRNDDFDYYLEYEEIREWFLQQTDLGERSQYKADVLEIAIEKLRRGYSAIVDEHATNFWWDYYHYANKNYPHLKMRKPPAGIPKGSGFMTFEPTDAGLGKRDQIIHKGYGAVDLQFAGKASEIEDIIAEFSDSLSDEMEIVEAGKSASIRIKIERIDTLGKLQEQMDIVNNALEKADTLYKWAKQNLLSNG